MKESTRPTGACYDRFELHHVLKGGERLRNWYALVDGDEVKTFDIRPLALSVGEDYEKAEDVITSYYIARNWSALCAEVIRLLNKSEIDEYFAVDVAEHQRRMMAESFRRIHAQEPQ